MKYSREQIRVMRARLQEYVDIGWNDGRSPLVMRCPLCLLWRSDNNPGCSDCPLGNEGFRNCNGEMEVSRRERLLRREDGSYSVVDRAAARTHARWLVRRYNAADSGGEWRIE